MTKLYFDLRFIHFISTDNVLGFWSLIPNFPHYLRQIGFSPLEFSVVCGAVPFSVMIFKPLLGDFADRKSKHKQTIIVCLSLAAICLGLIYTIPRPTVAENTVIASNSLITSKNTSLANKNATKSEKTNENIQLYTEGPDFDALNFTLPADGDVSFVYTYQFWTIFLLYTLGVGVGSFPAVTLMDAITMDCLKGQARKFGQQRMWMAPVGEKLDFPDLSTVLVIRILNFLLIEMRILCLLIKFDKKI